MEQEAGVIKKSWSVAGRSVVKRLAPLLPFTGLAEDTAQFSASISGDPLASKDTSMQVVPINAYRYIHISTGLFCLYVCLFMFFKSPTQCGLLELRLRSSSTRWLKILIACKK